MEITAPAMAPNERVGVVVLGMHRSGTSALARALNLLGCDLPKTLMGTLPSNETGHWESSAIAELNEEILRSAGSNWHDWVAFNPGWYSSPKMAEFREKARITLEAEFGTSHLFVMKDPRICRFVPFWLNVLETAGVRPALIIPMRNPIEVANSLSKRDGIEPAHGHLIWLRHVLDAESSTRNVNRIHCSYDTLLNSWPRLIADLPKAFGISWPRLSAQVGEEIGAFLSDRLRHHREAPAKLIDDPFVSPWLREAFAIFNRWAAEGEQQEDYATLDRIRAELDGAAPAFTRLVSSGWYVARKLKESNISLNEAQTALVETEAASTAHKMRADALEQNFQIETTQFEANAKELQAQLSQSQSALAQRCAETDELKAQLLDTQAILAESETRAAKNAEQAGELKAQLLDTQAKLAESETRAAKNAEQAGASKTAEVDNQIAALRAETAAAKARLADRFSEIAAMTRLLAEKESSAQLADEHVAWLRNVSTVLMNDTGSGLKGRLLSLLPAPIRLAKQKEKLKRQNIFDPAAYLTAYPDVADAGMDPLVHYIRHGMGEGRRLGLSHNEGM